mmetsp:Transcript_13782/g.24260  ORF Transcript_13782/g.24260 Transcript_13782/m.24260 type:complete len:160 (-) Transcript_13782:98-577(-)
MADEYSMEDTKATTEDRKTKIIIEEESDTSSPSDDNSDDKFEEDPLYDENLDEDDEKWMDKQRQGRPSDAILSCPACFTTLCLESQKHSHYQNQYRAVFTMNCVVDYQNPVSDAHTRVGRKKQKTAKLYTFSCSICAAKIGVVDEDEVYHFFEAIPTCA